MKSTILNLTLLFAFVFLLFSCNKMTEPENDNITKRKLDENVIKTLTSSISSNDDIMGTLEARCIKYETGTSLGDYSVSAYVYKDQTLSEWANVGPTTIGNYTINSPDSNNYYYHLITSTSNLPSFGTYGKFKINGNSLLNIPEFDTTLYVPEELSITNTFPNWEINNNQALTLQWNQDTQNDYCYIIINYNVILSNDYDSSLPDSSIFWTEKVPDTGSYTIPANVLQQFPMGSRLDLFLVRGNGLIVNKNGKKFLVFADDIVWLLLKAVN